MLNSISNQLFYQKTILMRDNWIILSSLMRNTSTKKWRNHKPFNSLQNLIAVMFQELLSLMPTINKSSYSSNLKQQITIPKLQVPGMANLQRSNLKSQKLSTYLVALIRLNPPNYDPLSHLLWKLNNKILILLFVVIKLISSDKALK